MAAQGSTGSAVEDAGTLLGAHPDYRPTETGFGTAFVDRDEWLTSPRPHRLVHGGFEGTETLFTCYFPPAEHYEGRLLKHLEGGAGGNEDLLQNAMFGAPWQYDFAFDELGAVLMESNQGHPPNAGHTGFHDPVYLFGASAESARFAKWLAVKLYGSEVHHAYVFGASGGGHRSFQCIMRRPDVFDGGVPEVFGVNPGPYWSVLGHAVMELGGDVRSVQDALEPGGSGDPFEGLSYPQREALRDLLQMGFPRDASTQIAYLPVFPFTLYNTIDFNPGYYRDFWETKGYVGHDAPERLGDKVLHFTTTVKEVANAEALGPAGLISLMTAGALPTTVLGGVVDFDQPERLFMAKLTFKTGKAAGREMVISSVMREDVLMPFGPKCPELWDDVEVGDEVEVDNRDWIAFCHLYQHSVEWNVPGLHGDDARVPRDYERFAVDGVPVHAQTGTSLYDLNEIDSFPGKMIYIGAVLDAFIWPTKVTSFDEYVRSVLGDRAEEHYRLWWVENSTHGPAMMGAMFTEDKDPNLWETRLVDYSAPGAAALMAVKEWVEDGIAPPASNAYRMTPDKHIELPQDADRGGVQPVVSLTVDGGNRAEVKVGIPVTFEGAAVVPTGTGTVVEAEMDFESTNTWPFQAPGADGSATTIQVSTTYTFDRPGTYFPVLRIGSHRDGTKRIGAAVRNLARVRVVVS